jgi:NADH-quinone oxidoreductase subunit H
VSEFFSNPAVTWTLLTTGGILLVVIWVLLSLAFLLLADRKIWAGVQMRKGPNVVGPFGLLQSFADFGKFVLKEIIIPAGADKVIFLLAPLLSLILAFAGWAVVPFAPGWVVSNLNVGILKYPFLGALRSAAQMVSYEVSIGLIIITVILLAGTMNLTSIVDQQAGWIWNWNVFGGAGLKNIILLPVMVIAMGMFFISALAETNRPPFDLPEAESELVAGYQVEYSSTPYLLFMVAEYSNIVLMCAMISVLFFGGWNPGFPITFTAGWPPFLVNFLLALVFYFKIVVAFFMIAMAKAIVPRYRYDQLMRLGWKVFLPMSLVLVMLVSAWRVFGLQG